MNPNGDVEAWIAVLSDPDSEPIPSMSPFGAVLMLAPLRTRIGSETEPTNLPTETNTGRGVFPPGTRSLWFGYAMARRPRSV